MDTSKRIVNELYPNKGEDIELLEKAIKDLENKIKELKKDQSRITNLPASFGLTVILTEYLANSSLSRTIPSFKSSIYTLNLSLLSSFNEI